MSTINFEVKKVKPVNKISDKQLDLFKPKENNKDEKSKKFLIYFWSNLIYTNIIYFLKIVVRIKLN